MKKIKILLCLCLSLLVSSILTTRAFAEEAEYGISISPTNIDVELSPNETYTGKITVRNAGSNPLTFNVFASPFQVEDHTYVSDTSTRNQYSEIVDWITFDQDTYSLEPYESVELTFTVNVPSNAHGGSQYATIGMSSDSGNGEGMVKASHAISVLFHADIQGDSILTEGSIVSTSTDSFLFNPPITAKVSVSNTGNITAKATTTMRVNNIIFGTEAYNNADNPVTYNVLPETIRDYDVSWDDAPSLGIFNVTISTTFIDDISTISKTVFICPMWFIVAVIGVIVAIIALLMSRHAHRAKINSRGFKFKN